MLIKADAEEYADAEYWIYRFFKADLLFRFHLHKTALDEYEKIGESGFGDMPYLISQTAAALNYMQGRNRSKYYTIDYLSWKCYCFLGWGGGVLSKKTMFFAVEGVGAKRRNN